MSEVSAENNTPDHIRSALVERLGGGHARMLIVPKDVTALEAACFAIFLSELDNRHLMPRKWNIDDATKHYGLERFWLKEPKS